MVSLAGRDILHSWSKFVLTGLGLGLLIGVTFTMAGVYRGMVDDAKVLLDNSGADVWVVQKDTLGPYAEPSSVHDDIYRSLLGLPGVAQASNVTYLTMQVRRGATDVRAMVVGFVPGEPGEPLYLIAGRRVTRSHYEAVADVSAGFAIGDRIRIRRHDYIVVGLTRRMVSSGGDPMVFIPLKDAQEAQFLKDNDAIFNERARSAGNPALNRPGVPGLLEAIEASQTSSHTVNAVLVRVGTGHAPDSVAAYLRQWKHVQAFTRVEMEEILIAKLIATASRQIGMFLVILTIVSAAIVAFIIYTMTLGKIREIAVLKLIGTHNSTIASMILQQALGLGVIGFAVGKIAATIWGPAFPRYVLLEPWDAVLGFGIVMLVCVLASTLAFGPPCAWIRPPPLEAEMTGGVGIQIEGLSKRYGEGPTAVDALKDVNMAVAPGEVVGLIGPSGSGKTTLLKCLGAVIEPTRGRITLGGQVIYDGGWKTADLRVLRRDRIGFIFQAPYLIPFLDATDNVALLPMLAGQPNAVARARARELLEALDVAHRAKALPAELSGGEQQRVSIARALANRPPVILADEPTAPLDSERGLAVMRILHQLASQYDTAIVVVTHDEKIIPTFKRTYHIRDGRTVEEVGTTRAVVGAS